MLFAATRSTEVTITVHSHCACACISVAYIPGSLHFDMCQMAFQKSVIRVFLTLIRNNFRPVENFETLKNSAKVILGLEKEIHKMNLQHPVVPRIKDLEEKKPH